MIFIVFYIVAEKMQDLFPSLPHLSEAGGQVVELLFVPPPFFF